MKNKNSLIAGRLISRKDEDVQAQFREPENKKPAAARGHFPSVAERVAQSSVCIHNWRFNGAREHFPNEPEMRCVDQYYPYAVGGALLVDAPQTEGDRVNCARKAVVMAKLGYNYLIIEADMDEFGAMERLRG